QTRNTSHPQSLTTRPPALQKFRRHSLTRFTHVVSHHTESHSALGGTPFEYSGVEFLSDPREVLRPKTLLAQTLDLPTVQHLAPPLHVTSGLLTTEDAETSVAAAAVDVDLLLGSADESDAFLPPDRTRSTTSARNTGGDAVFASALLWNSMACN
ncbi:hypothetical protein EDB83DRAFT_2371514, partial [Lactarius deliciosus]